MTALFSLADRTAVVTGASGAIGSAIALGFARAGANLALVYNSNGDAAEKIVKDAVALGVKARADQVNILDETAVKNHANLVASEFGRIDILVNSAGGNIKAAITDHETGFFDLALEDIKNTVDLNFINGVVSPCLAYGGLMAKNDAGSSIINISSMNAYRPLEGRPAYAAAKAAVNNFTQWLACHVAKEYTPAMRVNAIAPGFFPNERMRDGLFLENGALNERGQKIISHTPMGRLGDVADLIGPAIWYASDASSFVTGTVTPVDGGFNAYAGL
jgi:NAD(P)-dependent dehydrogenase (short-subunit alcohol dehydrogenase family)